jgi:hypothetical protein
MVDLRGRRSAQHIDEEAAWTRLLMGSQPTASRLQVHVPERLTERQRLYEQLKATNPEKPS